MVTCVVLIESVGTLNVSLIRDDKLLVNYIGDLPISHFINDKIDCLKVIFKPTLCNSVPENGYKLGNINVNGINKDCVISYDDFNSLSSFSCKVKDIQIYNYLDVCKSLFKDKDKVLVVDSWGKSLASVLYIEFGSVVDFRRVRYNKLSQVISKMSDKYGYFETINANLFYNIIELKAMISNIDSVDRNRLSSMKHLAYCLETQGTQVLDNSNEILNWQGEGDYSNSSIDSFPTEENYDSSKDYYARKLNNEDFDVESDYEEDDEFIENPSHNPQPQVEEKIGFFAKLFGKKSKKNQSAPSKKFTINDDLDEEQSTPSRNRKSNPSNRPNNSAPSRFAKYAEYEEDEDGEVSFSQIAVGDHRSSRKSNGYNPNVRKYSTVDYVFYVSFIVFLSCSLIFGGLQLIYKEKVGLLSSTYGSAVKMKNQMQSSVSLSETPANSPTIKVSQINNLSLPSSYNILGIDYSGNEYTVTLSVAESDNIDDFSSFLPDGVVLSKINPKTSNDSSKLYDIVLVTS